MPFADELINGHTAQSPILAVRTALPGAELASLHAAEQQLAPLALRQRADLLTDALLAAVPGDYADWRASCASPRRARRCSPDGSSGRSRVPLPRRLLPRTPPMPSTMPWLSWPSSPGG
jgi:hypothetical protein